MDVKMKCRCQLVGKEKRFQQPLAVLEGKTSRRERLCPGGCARQSCELRRGRSNGVTELSQKGSWTNSDTLFCLEVLINQSIEFYSHSDE